MKKITESSSLYNDLEKMSTSELIHSINQEDQKVAPAVEKELSSIEKLIDSAFEKMKLGGRIFYIGAGTSGRLGILDASECPPTYGVDHNTIIGIIAGGDTAIRKAVEFAEDDLNQAWIDLLTHQINENDFLIGIAASGSTPYVIGGIKQAKKNKILTGSITCNPDSEISILSDFPISINVGPEFVTGSTRMKAGTAQKMVLNMISTSLMIKLGKVKGNKMVDMQLSNIKLQDRAARMLAEEANISYQEAKEYIEKLGNVRNALNFLDKQNNKGI